MSLVSLNGTHYLKVHEISWCLYWKYLWLSISINSDSIHKKYMITLEFCPSVKVTANFCTSPIFFQGWKTIQYKSLVKSWLSNSLMSWLIVGHVQCVTTHTSALIMETLSQWPGSVIPPIRRLHYSLKWIVEVHDLVMNKSSICKEPITWIFYTTSNAPRSCTMQRMLGQNGHKV